jgi:hypothetical protein
VADAGQERINALGTQINRGGDQSTIHRRMLCMRTNHALDQASAFASATQRNRCGSAGIVWPECLNASSTIDPYNEADICVERSTWQA